EFAARASVRAERRAKRRAAPRAAQAARAFANARTRPPRAARPCARARRRDRHRARRSRRRSGGRPTATATGPRGLPRVGRCVPSRRRRRPPARIPAQRMERIAVTGAAGLIGRLLVADLGTDYDVLALDRTWRSGPLRRRQD